MKLTAIEGTALLTAAIRARESRRRDAMFTDPLAPLLAGEGGERLLDEYAPDGEEPYIPLRTRFFDDWILNLVRAENVRQVAILAAGMDSRAFRLRWPGETVLYEVDQRPIQDRKEAALASWGQAPLCHRRTVPTDLTADWVPSLLQAGFQPATPTLWLVEGFLMYLPEPSARMLLSRISAFTAPGSVLGTDLVNEKALTHPLLAAKHRVLKSWGTPWRFGTENPVGFLAECGWSAVVRQPGEVGADFGRWPHPVAEPGVSQYPQSFLLTARRSLAAS